MIELLLIDDEKEMLVGLEKILASRDDLELFSTTEPYKALEQINNDNFDIIISDLKIGNFSGIEILKAALEKYEKTKVIMISGYGTIEASVEAVQLGAFDFIEKPFTASKLHECLDKAIEIVRMENMVSKANISVINSEGIIYKSKQMSKVVEIAKKVAPQTMNVLILGESGTGKELIARAIHKLSSRKNYPFVPINCGALPENLFESELFGHERGAFTGAVNTKPGLLEFANKGTFFFDEIGDMSPILQVKLLRMLQDKKIRRVGGEKEIVIDVRIIAATNRDIIKDVNEKRFREDLFFRLNTIQIYIPPLRERTEDIIPMVNYFLKVICEKENQPYKYLTDTTKEILTSYSWPGNVRELQNLIERVYYLSSSNRITEDDLPAHIKKDNKSIYKNYFKLPYKEAKQQTLAKFESDYIQYHLKQNNGNISKTALACGIDRRTIHRIIDKLNIIYKAN